MVNNGLHIMDSNREEWLRMVSNGEEWLRMVKNQTC